MAKQHSAKTKNLKNKSKNIKSKGKKLKKIQTHKNKGTSSNKAKPHEARVKSHKKNYVDVKKRNFFRRKFYNKHTFFVLCLFALSSASIGGYLNTVASSGCEDPKFENYQTPKNKIYNGENLTLACNSGYYIQTKDVVRNCLNFKLVPDFKLSPAECLTGCPVPYYGHRSGPDRVLDGEEWTAACTDGFGVSTDVLVRKCTNNVLSPTLESNPVSCFKVCGTPPKMLNGNHSGPNNPKIGEVIRYTCNEGFFSYGINSDVFETECLEQRTYSKYSKDLASCYAISCTTPAAITNGTYNETLTEKYIQNQFINGFYCDSGFLPFPSDGFIECGPNGWIENATCKLVCWPPPPMVNGRHLETDNRNRPFPNTTVKYACNEGFFAYGNNSENLETVCLEDRSYTLQGEQLASCARIACKKPIMLENGVFDESLEDYYIEGKRISFTCNELHDAEPQNTDETDVSKGIIHCGKDGWLVPHFCHPVCSLPPSISHASHDGSLTVRPRRGTIINYECNENAHPIANKDIRQTRCLNDGSYSVSEDYLLKCTRTRCRMPDSFSNGNFLVTLKDRYAEGETVDFKCELGFVSIADEETYTLKCLVSGWHTKAMCGVVCGSPPSYPSTKWRYQYELATDNMMAIYSCTDSKKSFIPSKDYKLACVGTSWVGSIGVCYTKTRCSAPVSLRIQFSTYTVTWVTGERGEVLAGHTLPRTQVNIRCPKNRCINPRGFTRYVCGDNGKWKANVALGAELPRCDLDRRCYKLTGVIAIGNVYEAYFHCYNKGMSLLDKILRRRGSRAWIYNNVPGSIMWTYIYDINKVWNSDLVSSRDWRYLSDLRHFIPGSEQHFCYGEPDNGGFLGRMQQSLALVRGHDVHATCMRDEPNDYPHGVICEYQCNCCCGAGGGI